MVGEKSLERHEPDKIMLDLNTIYQIMSPTPQDPKKRNQVAIVEEEEVKTFFDYEPEKKEEDAIDLESTPLKDMLKDIFSDS